MMSIHYSTNWMGPVVMRWYRDRGLTKTVVTTLTENSLTVKWGNNKAGDVVEHEDITEQWAGGRIDVYGTGDPYGYELGLPIMHSEDYNRFSDWLKTFETDDVWTLAQLVEMYERVNPKIRWADDVFKDVK